MSGKIPVAEAFVLFEDRLAPAGGVSARLLTGLVGQHAYQTPAALEAWLEEAQGAGHWVAMALDYELGLALEPAAASPDWRGDAPHPLAIFWAFSGCEVFSADQVAAWLEARLRALPADSLRAGIGGLTPAIDFAAYESGVSRILDYISAGDCYQVNYTFPLDFYWFGHPLALYAALRREQPVGHGALFSLPALTALSFSPELFVKKTGRRLIVRPMKGTAARLADPVPDELAREALQCSQKNRAENLMIVDLLRNDLGRLAIPGSVAVTSLFEVETYPTVHQMVSQVEARVAHGGLAEVLAALFPCGSITGAPKIRAMQIISELEVRPRGLYTGSLGLLDPEGDFHLNVAIRTLRLEGNSQGSMGIGSGIVADSEPMAEWEECLLKGAFLTRLDPGVELIETLRLEVAGGTALYPLLERHLERLARSADWLGFSCDKQAVLEQLAGAARQCDGIWRVRLGLKKSGELAVTVQALGEPPAGPLYLNLACQPIHSRDPLRQHKTTARSLYDQALAGIAATPEVFDVLFCNERGEVVEGARSNVFVQLDGRWYTPPLSAGCLPGVLRAELLDRGEVEERVLRLDDLRKAQALRCGNALRGLVEVCFAMESGDLLG